MFTRLLLACLLAYGFLGCDHQKHKEPYILTTTSIIESTTKELVGEHIAVMSLMGPSIDPHDYKPTARDLERIKGATVIITNGLELEGRLSTVLNGLSQKVHTIQMTDGIPPNFILWNPEGSADPHVWQDPILWLKAATYLKQELEHSFPHKKELFNQNFQKLQNKVLQLHQTISEDLSKIEQDKRVLITTHDAFRYFGKRYGIDVYSVQGISTTAQYGVRDIDRVVEVIAQKRIPVIFAEATVNTYAIEAVKNGSERKNVVTSNGGKLYTDALSITPEASSWIKMIEHNAQTIFRGLSRKEQQ